MHGATEIYSVINETNTSVSFLTSNGTRVICSAGTHKECSSIDGRDGRGGSIIELNGELHPSKDFEVDNTSGISTIDLTIFQKRGFICYDKKSVGISKIHGGHTIVDSKDVRGSRCSSIGFFVINNDNTGWPGRSALCNPSSDKYRGHYGLTANVLVGSGALGDEVNWSNSPIAVQSGPESRSE